MRAAWLVVGTWIVCVAGVAGQEPATPAPQSGAPPVAAEEPVAPAAAGPAIMVTGCLQATDGKGKNDAETFALAATEPPTSLSEQPAPAGVEQYRLVGLLPDLRRHVGHQVEIIGAILDRVPPDSSRKDVTLETHSVLATAETCQKTGN